MVDKTRVVMQAAMSDKELAEFKLIAQYRSISMSAVLRQWIRKAFKALPDDAK